MGLSDLTDSSAVRRAIHEFDEIGRDRFLEKYGFRESLTYFLEHDGIRYDSKAIVGAAHGYQHGTPLRADEFSGGEKTVAPLLASLGFVVTRPAADWVTPIGYVGTRTEFKELYGGSIYGGIESSRTTPNILIYTDPDQGALSGYDYDGPDPDDDRVFYYTGEGRTGDQELRVGNKAIYEHAQSRRTLRLFEALKEKAQPGGKRHRYLGAFRLDPEAPYRREPANDAEGNPRQVIVFRLLRDEIVEAARQPARPEPAKSGKSEVLSSPQVYVPGGPAPAAHVELVASEINLVLEYETVPRAGRIASRDEARLVLDFESWLRNQGHELQRARITIPGQRHSLVTDTHDVTTQILYEAKSGTDRATVRLGIGQLMDYLRFLPEARGALLLPEEPEADLKSLIASCGFGLVYRSLGQWVVLEPANADR